MNNLPCFMHAALAQAQQAALRGEVPVGAVVVYKGAIIAKAHNNVIDHKDPTAHAEIVALREAAAHLQNEFLSECDVYVTLEPCPMCAGAIAHARIRRLYFGAYDPKGGGVEHGPQVFKYSLHKPAVWGGLDEQACSQILRDFFAQRRHNA
jgi:tRNA(adenine34) deaminase